MKLFSAVTFAIAIALVAVQVGATPAKAGFWEKVVESVAGQDLGSSRRR